MKKSRFLFITGVALSVLLVAGAVWAASVSNLWTSPDVTVTTYVPPTPQNLPLVVSSPDFVSPQSVYTEVPFLANVTLSNPSSAGSPGYANVTVLFTVDKPAIVPGDVTLEYSDGTWHTLTLVQNGVNSLSASFGPVGGFPVDVGYNQSTPLRATFHTNGTYHATAQAVIP